MSAENAFTRENLNDYDWLEELSEEKSSFAEIGFYDFLMEWLESYKHSIEGISYAGYKNGIIRYIKGQREAQIPIKSLTPMHIQALYNRLIDRGLSPNTVLKLHANVRKALQYAYTIDMLPTNPAGKVMLPKKRRYAADFYDESEVRCLLDAAHDEAIYPAILIAAFYGLRRSEVLGLKWEAVDFNRGVIHICNTVVEYKDIDDKIVVEEKERTKTKASYRTLPLTQGITDY